MLVFFGLTRTQVGRDGLRLQLIRSFDAEFEGRLEIDRLSGNLVNDLFAGGVRVYDAAGTLVLSADSVVAAPDWRDLLRRRVSLGSLTLYRPEVNLVRLTDGRWNVADAFERVRPRSSAPSSRDPWSFTTLHLRIVDGAIESRNYGAPPDLVARGHFFDFTNASASDVDVRATVDWKAPTRIVEIQEASAQLTTLDLPLTTLQGQLVMEADNALVPLLDFELGHSRGRISGAVSGIEALKRSDFAGASIQANLVDARLDNGEMQRLFPSSPLRDQLNVTLRLQGPLTSLVLEEFALARGDSQLRLEGTVRGLPQAADFEAAVREAHVRTNDLQAVAPSVDWSSYAHLDPFSAAMDAHGIVPLEDGTTAPTLSLAATWKAEAPGGSAQGSIAVRRGRDDPLAYEATIETDGLDLSRILDEASLAGRIRGRITVAGQTVDFTDHHTLIAAQLGPSVIGGRSLDTLRAEARLDGPSLEAMLSARTRGGTLGGRLRAQLGELPAYQLALNVAALDAGPLLLKDSLRTDLNGHLQIDGTGRTWDTFRGEVAFVLDTSRVALGARERLVLPQRTTVSIADAADGTSLVEIGGDVLQASFTGSTNPKVLARTASLWTSVLGNAAYRDVLKPYPHAGAPSLVEDPLIGDALDRDLSEERLRLIALARPTGGVNFSGTVRVRNAPAIAALFPELPPLATDLRMNLSMESDDASLRGSLSVDADSLAFGQSELRGLALDAEISGRLGAGVDDDVSLRILGNAERVDVGERSMPDARLDLSLVDGSGHLLVSAGDSADASFDLSAQLRSLDDRTLLTLDRIRYAAGDYVWLNADRDVVDLYEGAAVIHDMTLMNEDRSRDLVQQVRVSGALSSVPGDTLVFLAQNIALHQLSRAFAGPAFGGHVSGRVAFTGGVRQPELTGRLDVQHFHFDNRLLGNLRIRSHYVPGMPDVQIDALLAPAQGALPETTPDGTRPLIVEENQLRLSGRFRLPTFDERRRQVSPSELDLTLDAERADAFFFEYLFPQLTDVSGHLSGQGSIRGSLNDPIFDVGLHLADASFAVPDYNLRFQATADGFIDRSGIHITDGAVRDKTGGTGRISGDILFNDYRFFSFNLAGRLQELQIMDVTDSRRGLAFYGRIWASGNATLTGPISDALLASPDVVTSPRSEVYIPLTEVASATDPGFILFADSVGNVPDFSKISRRENLLARRPVGERPFVDALEMDLNIFAPPGSTVRLVIDPLLGDVMNAVGTGRIQLVRSEGDYLTFGTLNVSAGDYLFTAGDVFMRRFLIDQGTIRWDGDPTDAQLDVWASYRTRASSAGLPGLASDAESAPLIPLLVRLHITQRVSSPSVDLSLALERRDQDVVAQGLEAILNDPERSTQYATSVLLTNTFLLTTDQFADGDATGNGTRGQFAFNSVSQLVASQINRYLSYALPNVDVNFGLQGERAQDLDVTYGVALRLMDERLVIRGEGVYQNDRQNPTRGEFMVQVRLTPSVSVEMFYRREGDILSDQTLTNTTGAGVSYETRFSNWDLLFRRILGREPEKQEEEEDGERV